MDVQKLEVVKYHCCKYIIFTLTLQRR